MEYILLLLSFLATIFAIFGNTKDEKTRKITTIGYLTSAVGLLAFVISIYKTYSDSNASDEKDLLLKKMGSQLDTSSIHIVSLKKEVGLYKTALAEIIKQSERQPQWTMLDYFYLKPGERKTLPVLANSGSILRFVGNSKSKLVLEYDIQKIEIPELDYRFPPEIPIIGRSGWSGYCIVKNMGNEDNGFKIYILSTPRSRSSVRSWLEEAHQ